MEKQSNNSKVRFDLEQRKVLISASLVSVIALISLTNQSLVNRTENRLGREIASLNLVRINYGQLEWQKNLAKRLAEKEARDPASLGHRATPFEQLRFGFFEGKYAFQLEHGKVKAIDFVDAEFSNDRPKYITNKTEFLKEWKNLFWVEFSKIEKESESAEKNLIREKYKLITDGKVVGHAMFVSDVHGRAHSIKLEAKN